MLLADDSLAIQKVIDLTFTDEGMEVTAVGDTKDALEAIERISPDLVLADEINRVLSKRRDLTPPDLVSRLAHRFAVSPAAMQYRLINLGMLDPYSLAG